MLLELLDDEDDVLVVLADQLSQLVDSVGGTDYAHCLLTPLENLSTVEEPSVREHVRVYICIDRIMDGERLNACIV